MLLDTAELAIPALVAMLFRVEVVEMVKVAPLLTGVAGLSQVPGVVAVGAIPSVR
jgi:hypothetical protein